MSEDSVRVRIYRVNPHMFWGYEMEEQGYPELAGKRVRDTNVSPVGMSGSTEYDIFRSGGYGIVTLDNGWLLGYVTRNDVFDPFLDAVKEAQSEQRTTPIDRIRKPRMVQQTRGTLSR